MVDQLLEDHDLARDVVYTTPNYLQAAHIVASSDLATVLPTQLAQHFAKLLPLQLFDLPFDLDSFQLDLVSVAQRERDAALQWLIEQIVAVAKR
jgi:DNA-binding transcriptional LysR family regulator